MILLEQKELEY